MVVNLQDFISHNPFFRKFEVGRLLFVEYQCLIEKDASEVWSPDNYFAYALGGKKAWKTLQNEYLVQAGDAIFVKKGANTVYQYFDDAFIVLFVFVPDEFIKYVVNKYELRLPPDRLARESDTVIPLDTDDILSSYFQSLLSYFTWAQPPSPALLKIKFEELITNIITYSRNPSLTHYFRELCNSRKVSLRQIMEQNFSKRLSLDEFARLSSRSLSTFKRDFSKAFDMPPGKWLVEKRLAFGKYLIETTDKNINEVSLESGFKSRPHFSKAFKRKFGLSPAQFKGLKK